MSLARLKWLAIIAPAGFLAVFAFLLRATFHSALHEFPGVLILIGGLAAGVAAFSFIIFGVIGRLERRIVQRNQELAALLAVGHGLGLVRRAARRCSTRRSRRSSRVTPAEAAEVWLPPTEAA